LRKIGKSIGIALALPRQEPGQRARVGRSREPVARLRGDGDNPVPPGRDSDDAADEWKAAIVQKARAYAISRDHEVLDERLRPVRRLRAKVAQSVPVENRRGIDGRKVQRA